MALDGTLFNLPDTLANEQAFGRSRNRYGKGAYAQARVVLLPDGSYPAQLVPNAQAAYPMQRPQWVRIIEYQLTDERLGEPGGCGCACAVACCPRVPYASTGANSSKSTASTNPRSATLPHPGRLSRASALRVLSS